LLIVCLVIREKIMSTIDKLSKVSANIMKSELELVLEQLSAIVYVCDVENYQILYMNQFAKQVYGDGIGKRCWEWFQNDEKEACAFCNNNSLKENPKEVQIRDYFNPFNNKWYEVQDKFIDWTSGQKAKMRIAYPIDHRKEDEKKLIVLYKQQELFSKISTSFNKPAAFADKVNDVLKLVGEFVDVSRVSIYTNKTDSNTTDLVYEWCKEGIQTKIDRFPHLKYDASNEVFKKILENDILNANDINDAVYHEELKEFRMFNTRAMLLIPMYLHKRHVGFVGFEDCNNIRVWQKDEIQLLRTFGNIVSTSFERKRIEEERLRSERNLREANATKDKFFSIVTRDLLTPFSDLTSLSSILLDNYKKWDDEKRLKFLGSIKESSKHGYKLLENLITWSKMQSGQIDFFPQPVDIRSVINLSLEQLKAVADGKGIVISGAPQDFTFVMADYLMLNTIIRNLLNNAIKFTPEHGKIDINLSKIEGFLEISIQDNGIGIDKQYLSNLFRIDLDNSSFGPIEEKGTGLGLIICKEFVEKNGGQIWAESEPGVGSSFKFTIPLVEK